MKFVILLALLVCAVTAQKQTKEQLEERATKLEARLAEEIAKVKADRPREAELLEVEERELKVIAGELTKATQDRVVEQLERRLGELERRVEEQLNRIEGRTGTEGTRGTRPTRPEPTPTEAPTTSA